MIFEAPAGGDGESAADGFLVLAPGFDRSRVAAGVDLLRPALGGGSLAPGDRAWSDVSDGAALGGVSSGAQRGEPCGPASAAGDRGGGDGG